MTRPDFFLVGAAKSGSTSMYQYLRQHPQVYMPPVKWINYFNRDLAAPGNCPDEASYLEHFEPAGDAIRVGEASESSLYSTEAAAAIRDFCPSARILILLRNPVDVIHALHSQLVFSHVEPIADFELALRAEADRAAGRRLPQRSHHPVEWLLYRRTVRFAEQVKRYFDVFGRDRVHVELFDDLKTDTAAVYRRTLEFLDVDRDFEPEFRTYNANTTVRNRRIDRFVHRPPAAARQIVRALVPSRAVRARLAGRVTAMNVKVAPRAPMTDALRDRLQRSLQPEVSRLAELIGRDLSSWGTTPAARQAS